MAQFNKSTHEYLRNNKTLFEVVMLADQQGNSVEGGNPTGTAVDAFGRARQSSPLTLFDSFNRYDANDKFSELFVSGGAVSFNTNTSTVSLEVDGSLGSKVVRETNRVFAYQPGKSLQIFNTFVMDTHSPGLQQRVGYYNDENGIFIELDDDGLHFVKRTNISGTPSDVRVNQSSWSIDPLDGSGPSLNALDITKAQIFWMDIEWLGVGSVRCGFVIDGKFIHCHTFNHANRIDSVYMTTAILPLRYEIENTTVGPPAVLQQICSTVISEGGYEFRGSGGYASRGLTKKSVGTTLVPLISIQLDPTRPDAIAVIQGITATGDAAGAYELVLVKDGTLTNDSFNPAFAGSSVEFDIAATGITGGKVLGGTVAEITNQSSLSLDFGGDLFDLQLERNASTGTTSTYTLAARTDASSAQMSAAFNWQEVT